MRFTAFVDHGKRSFAGCLRGGAADAVVPAKARRAKPRRSQQRSQGPSGASSPLATACLPVTGWKRKQGYPEQLEDALRQGGINARVIDAGVSGDTSAAGRQRLAFTLDAQDTPPDLVLLELGGNDMLRGIQPDQTRANFAAMLDELRARISRCC